MTSSPNGLIIILIGSLFVITLVALAVDTFLIQEHLSFQDKKISEIYSIINSTKPVKTFSDADYVQTAH